MKKLNIVRSSAFALAALVALGGAASAQVINQGAVGGGNTSVQVTGGLGSDVFSGTKSGGSINGTGAINQISASVDSLKSLGGVSLPATTLAAQSASNYSNVSVNGAANSNRLSGYGSSVSIGAVGAANSVAVNIGQK